MAPTKHFVITPDGKRHTRTSQKRVYSHVIVLSPPKASNLGAIARESQDVQNAYAAKYRKVFEAAEAREEFQIKPVRYGSHIFQRYYLAGEEVTVWITKGWGADMRVIDSPHEALATIYREHHESAIQEAQKYAERAAEFEAMHPDTEVGDWSVVGWSSSAALASPRARGGYLTTTAAKRGQSIRVLEAQIA